MDYQNTLGGDLIKTRQSPYGLAAEIHKSARNEKPNGYAIKINLSSIAKKLSFVLKLSAMRIS